MTAPIKMTVGGIVYMISDADGKLEITPQHGMRVILKSGTYTTSHKPIDKIIISSELKDIDL